MAEQKSKKTPPRRNSIGTLRREDKVKSGSTPLTRKSYSDGLESKQMRKNVLKVPRNEGDDDSDFGISSRQSSKLDELNHIGGGLLPEDIRLKGWIKIKNSSGLFKTWKNHYCVITDNAIYLYKNEKEVSSFERPTRKVLKSYFTANLIRT
jgi:hypothetical protein